jgi:hypothetical protein
MYCLINRPSDAVFAKLSAGDDVSRYAHLRERLLAERADAEYQRMLDQLCDAYKARWHM